MLQTVQCYPDLFCQNNFAQAFISECVSTGLTRVPRFSPDLVFALEPSKLQKPAEYLQRGLVSSVPNSGMHQALVRKTFYDS